jgi:hypothetical protein
MFQDHVLPLQIDQQHLSFLRHCFSLRPANRPSADKVLAFVRGELLHCITKAPRTAEAVAVRLLNIHIFVLKLISLPG